MTIDLVPSDGETLMNKTETFSFKDAALKREIDI